MEKIRQIVGFDESHVLFRQLNKKVPIIDHGRGVYLVDKSGKRYLDGSSGAYVVSLGHGNKEIIEAMYESHSRVAYVNGFHFSSEETEELAERLHKLARQELNQDYRCLFLASGSEAVEASIKFARQLWIERDCPERTKVIARVPGYHGNTLYALSASGRPAYQKYFKPLLSSVIMVRSPYEADAEKVEHYIAEFQQKLEMENARSVMAMIVEPVMGSSGGGSPPPKGYFEAIQSECRKASIPIIADEVLCGSGRTGAFFASSKVGLTPDFIVLGKGISSGYVPLSAVLVKEEIALEMKRGSGKIQHQQTYINAPCMTSAGVATLKYFEEHRVLDHVRLHESLFLENLREVSNQHARAGAVTGCGFLGGIEIVQDKHSRSPFPKEFLAYEKFAEIAFENGLICWGNPGHRAGDIGDLVLLAPPLISNATEIKKIGMLLHESFKEFEVRYS